VHAANKIFSEEDTDAVLLADASNAFNSLNREAMLHIVTTYVLLLQSTYTTAIYYLPDCS